MTPHTERQKGMIVKNIVRACNDISALNNIGYGFIYVASGFIAHYNINGFKEHYTKHSLKDDIIRNARMNAYLNFKEGEKNYEYYKGKADIYLRILEQIA